MRYLCCMKAYFTRKAMHVKHNTVERSQTTTAVEKALSITYSECMSVALIIQQEKHKHHIVQYYDYYYHYHQV